MTVRELIERLEAFQDDADVWVRIPDHVQVLLEVDFPVLDAVVDEESPAVFIVG